MTWFLATYFVMVVLTYGVLNGHSFDDRVFYNRRIGVLVACLFLTPITFGVAVAYCYCWGFKFRLKP